VIESDRPVPAAVPLDREWQEVEVAILLVASGSAPRVVVAGLSHAAELIARMTARATLAGVRLLPLPTDAPRGVLVATRPVVVPQP
jgi:hypothetical protein